MTTSAQDLAHLCKLANSLRTKKTLEKISRQFTDIINYIDTLSEAKTENTAPLYSPVFHESAVREDKAFRKQTPEQILKNAPETDGTYFIVPKIVEGK